MPRGLLKDVSPVVAAVLNGDHDEVLDHLERAVKLRRAQRAKQSGLVPGSRVRVTEEAADGGPELVGREGKVERVNPKSVSVTLDKAHEHDYRTGWRLPASWLEVIPPSEGRSR